MPCKAFAVIYRFYLKKSKEDDYLIYWKEVANYFVQKRGALSSNLHKTQEGYFLAYSKWPDKATKEASWSKSEIKNDLPLEIKMALLEMKKCINLEKEVFPEIEMTLMEQSDTSLTF